MTVSSNNQTPTPPAQPSPHVVPVVLHDGVAYVSGQLPRQDGQLRHRGTVGVDVDLEDACAAARLGAHACLHALETAVGGPDNVRTLLKVTGYIASAPGFTAQGMVLDAASEVFVAALGDAGRPARSAIGVAALPHGASVEIELIAAVRASEKAAG